MKITLSNHEKEIVKRLRRGDRIIDWTMGGGSTGHFVELPRWENGEKIERESLNNLVNIGSVRAYSSISSSSTGERRWIYEYIPTAYIEIK